MEKLEVDQTQIGLFYCKWILLKFYLTLKKSIYSRYWDLIFLK